MRKRVILICTECLARNYTTTINKDGQTERFEIKKFCPTCKKYTIHKESK